MLSALKVALLNYVYPIGSIYISTAQISPASFLGGTWTALSEGYALWTTTSSNTGGSTISSALPNIYGEFSAGKYEESYSSTIYATGAFSTAYYTTSVTNGYCNGSNMQSSGNIHVFDASTYNSVYGAATYVRPRSYRVYMWKRTA